MGGVSPNSRSFMAARVVEKTKQVVTSEGTQIFDLKTTLLAGQQLISYGKTKFGEVCLAVFAVGWQKMNNEKILPVFVKISMLENFLSFLAVFNLSCAAHPFTLILQNKGKNEGAKPMLKVTASKYFQLIL